MSKKPRRYRPGIDDPPPSNWAWIAGLLGLTALAGLATAVVKKLKRAG